MGGGCSVELYRVGVGVVWSCIVWGVGDEG